MSVFNAIGLFRAVAANGFVQRHPHLFRAVEVLSHNFDPEFQPKIQLIKAARIADVSDMRAAAAAGASPEEIIDGDNAVTAIALADQNIVEALDYLINEKGVSPDIYVPDPDPRSTVKKTGLIRSLETGNSGAILALLKFGARPVTVGEAGEVETNALAFLSQALKNFGVEDRKSRKPKKHVYVSPEWSEVLEAMIEAAMPYHAKNAAEARAIQSVWNIILSKKGADYVFLRSLKTADGTGSLASIYYGFLAQSKGRGQPQPDGVAPPHAA